MIMKQVSIIACVIVLLACSLSLMAQKSKGGSAQKKGSSSGAKESNIYTYLGRSDYRGGKITKKMFDSLLKQGITARDTLGNVYKIDGFVFNYNERNVYEDSVGNLMMLTDLHQEFCTGDTISLALRRNIFYKTKAGDTAYIENVKVSTPSGQSFAKGMKFTLTR